ncbi:MAG TPA: hypothetical protein VN692_17710 [Steroidobacteraceae bacterium]|nr:hypothetical protein [Steroidobacteraceae bacterium]
MSFSITESDLWPRVARSIVEERARRLRDLLHVGTVEAMRKEQGFIEALDWVVGEASPKPEPRQQEDDD